MPLQDLTPQLRTRLNRMERAVGWFIMLATLLLLAGFGYYLYKTAQNRGWFAVKAKYYTYADSGNGFSVGDKVKLMGFEAGQITDILPMPPRGPGSEHNVYIEFVVLEKNVGYIWTQGSLVKFVDAGFLGKRELDLTRGTNGYSTYIHYNVREMSLADLRAATSLDKLHLGEDVFDGTNLVAKAWSPLATNLDRIATLEKTNLWVIDLEKTNAAYTAVWNTYARHYEKVTAKTKYELAADEPPSLSDRIQTMVAQVQAALPGVWHLTNQLGQVLSNSANLTSNLNDVAAGVRPVITNLNLITAQLKNPDGSLGQWLIPTNLNERLDATLVNANGTVTHLNSNLASLNLTLNHVADITSNLNNQVQANTNILSNISSIVVHTDEFIQGLKRFWLFRHVFAAHPAKTPPPRRKVEPALSPRQKGELQ